MISLNLTPTVSIQEFIEMVERPAQQMQKIFFVVFDDYARRAKVYDKIVWMPILNQNISKILCSRKFFRKWVERILGFKPFNSDEIVIFVHHSQLRHFKFSPMDVFFFSHTSPIFYFLKQREVNILTRMVTQEVYDSVVEVTIPYQFQDLEKRWYIKEAIKNLGGLERGLKKLFAFNPKESGVIPNVIKPLFKDIKVSIF